MSTAKIKIVNHRGDDDQLNLLLTANSVSGLTGMSLCSSLPLHAFPAKAVSFDTIDTARLYVGYGTFQGPPASEGNQYYGWIEFSKTDEKTVWINLSNVDMVGLPLGLAGNMADGGTSWTLGYNTGGVSGIITNLEKIVNNPDLEQTTNSPAVKKCATGQIKVVAPNILPDSYPSFTSYVNTLKTAEAQLVIFSDAPADGRVLKFTGSFLNAVNDNDPIISLTSTAGDTFQILQGQLITENIYRCDGGTLTYKNQEYPQNNTDKSDTAIITNSLFREIVIGLNEGYFTTSSVNYSCNFPCLSPFTNNPGNQYARAIHAGSNSYGFPYADSNLKVLIQADASQPITLTILKDDESFGYSVPGANTECKPVYGEYQFGIGAGSETLGTISIGNCTYLPNANGAYGGYLPTMSNWTKMSFLDGKEHIWIKTTDSGYVSADNCFLSGKTACPPLTWQNNVLTWPAAISWNPQATSPAEPPSA